jgi:preprotein translocase subunit SecF
MRVFHNLNVDFLGKRKFFYIFHLFIFNRLLSVVFKGLSFGIDFKGGSEIVLQFEKQIDIAEVRKDIENIGLGNVEVRTFGGETGALIRTELQQLPDDVYPNVVKSIEDEIKNIVPNVAYNIVEKTATSITYSFPNPDTTNLVAEKLLQLISIRQRSKNCTQIDVSVFNDWIKEI